MEKLTKHEPQAGRGALQADGGPPPARAPAPGGRRAEAGRPPQGDVVDAEYTVKD